MDAKQILEKLGWVKKIDARGDFYVLKTKTIRFIKTPIHLGDIETYETDLTKEELNNLYYEMAKIQNEID